MEPQSLNNFLSGPLYKVCWPKVCRNQDVLIFSSCFSWSLNCYAYCMWVLTCSESKSKSNYWYYSYVCAYFTINLYILLISCFMLLLLCSAIPCFHWSASSKQLIFRAEMGLVDKSLVCLERNSLVRWKECEFLRFEFGSQVYYLLNDLKNDLQAFWSLGFSLIKWQ